VVGVDLVVAVDAGQEATPADPVLDRHRLQAHGRATEHEGTVAPDGMCDAPSEILVDVKEQVMALLAIKPERHDLGVAAYEEADRVREAGLMLIIEHRCGVVPLPLDRVLHLVVVAERLVVVSFHADIVRRWCDKAAAALTEDLSALGHRRRMIDTAALKSALQLVIGVAVVTFVVGVLAVLLVEREGQRLDAPKLTGPDVPAAVTPG
jgi:hypothetical protein